MTDPDVETSTGLLSGLYHLLALLVGVVLYYLVNVRRRP